MSSQASIFNLKKEHIDWVGIDQKLNKTGANIGYECIDLRKRQASLSIDYRTCK